MQGWKSLIQSKTFLWALAIVVVTIVSLFVDIDPASTLADVEKWLNILLGVGVVDARIRAKDRIASLLPPRVRR